MPWISELKQPLSYLHNTRGILRPITLVFTITIPLSQLFLLALLHNSFLRLSGSSITHHTKRNLPAQYLFLNVFPGHLSPAVQTGRGRERPMTLQYILHARSRLESVDVLCIILQASLSIKLGRKKNSPTRSNCAGSSQSACHPINKTRLTFPLSSINLINRWQGDGSKFEGYIWLWIL